MSKKINLYIMIGAIPSLYAQINVVFDNAPSYVWVRSSGLYLPENGPDNLIYYHTFGLGYPDIEYMNHGYQDIVSKINEIKKFDQEVKFTVFVDDSRVQYILKPLIEAGIYDDIEKFIIVCEGSIAEPYFDSINSSYFHDYKEKWDHFVSILKNNSENIDNELIILDKYAPWFSTNENVEYLLPCRDLIIDWLKNKNVDFNKMNLKEFDIEKKYLNLSLKERSAFSNTELNIDFDRNNKYLIIIGTYDFGSPRLTTQICILLIDKLLAYSIEYNKIFYKPHPMFPTSNKPDLEEYLSRHDIETLPSKMPIEVILWDNQNIDIAGFCSSINALIGSERTIAFFGEIFGFSKLLYNANKFNAKIHNIEISQRLAGVLFSDYYEIHGSLNNIDEGIKFQHESLISMDGRFKPIDKSLNFLHESLIAADGRYNSVDKSLNFLHESLVAADGKFNALDKSLNFLHENLVAADGKFNAVDKSLNFLHENIVAADRKFSSIDERLVSVDEKFNYIDERLNANNERLKVIEENITRLNHIIDKLLIPFKPFLYIKRKLNKKDVIKK